MKLFIATIYVVLLVLSSNSAYAGLVKVSYDKGYDSYIPPYVRIPHARDVLKTRYTDVECLALNIYHEARGESRLGQEIVAQVTMNRVKYDAWPDTVCDVVKQDRQFSWTKDGRPDHVTDINAYITAFIIASEYIHKDKQVDFPQADRITNYHTKQVNPKHWAPWVELVGEVGNHLVYVPSDRVILNKTKMT